MKKGIVFTSFFILAFILAITLVFSNEYFLRQVGGFLVVKQEPHSADFIVILNGRPTERCLAAADLYKKKYADTIIMAFLAKQAGTDEFWRRVGKGFRQKSFSQRALEAMDVPEKAIRFIGNGVGSTYDEAKATLVFVREHGGQSIILVTSKWHSKRTYLTFKSVFKHEKGINITIFPSPYDTFNPDVWWKSDIDLELVFREYLRLFYYCLTGRISFF